MSTDKYSNCRRKKCAHGEFLTTLSSSYIGENKEKETDLSLDQFFDAVEEEDEEVEFIMLPTPSAYTEDVEKDDDGLTEERNIVSKSSSPLIVFMVSSYCHSNPCYKFITFFKDTNFNIL